VSDEPKGHKTVAKVLALSVLGIVLFLAGTRGLYFFPTSVALGPCLPDWTSPSTYLSFFQKPASPMQMLRFEVGRAHVQICYGQPSARGRVIFDNDSTDSMSTDSSAPVVPYNTLWRMGANEPTRIFIDAPVILANVRLEPGRYSIYAIPNSDFWEVFVTGSTFHWGNQISESVRRQELGSFRATVTRTEKFQERLIIFPRSTDGQVTDLVVAWADREIEIPVRDLE
jgi:hypothetical protein